MNNTTCVGIYADEEQTNACKEKLKWAQKSVTELSKIFALPIASYKQEVNLYDTWYDL